MSALPIVSRTVLLLSLALAACGDDDGGHSDTGLAACDPLAGSAQPIELGEVLGVGRDADGVVYALDRPDEGELRAFVSDGDVLQRHRVLGSGSGTVDDVEFYDVGVEAAPPFTLYLELPAGGEPRFTKITTEGRNEPDAAAEGEPLELLGEDDLRELTLRDLPPDVEFEYFGAIEDGRRVAVTRPTDDWSYDDFRVFLGESERMLEREVTSVVRARDGGSTTIELTLDGRPATLRFPIVSVDGGFAAGPATLEHGGETLDIALLVATPAALAPLAFFCR